jgi:selenocysteine-specific elongation factor
LEQEGLIRREGGKVALPEAASRVTPEERRMMDRIYKVFEEGAFQTPRLDELPARLRAPQEAIDRLVELLCLEKRLARLPNQVILTFNHFKWAQDRAVRIMQERGALESWDFKNEIHSSRKFALAILDRLDAQRVTVNINNTRRLAPDYQKRLV